MSASDLTLELVEPDSAVYADYSARFEAYNAHHAGWTTQSFSYVHREGERIVAGGRGHVYLGILEIRGLWVDDDLRGTGLGSKLLKAIEAEGIRRGASKAWLYTYSWQAEEFYQYQGYTEYARLDFPEGHARIDMSKELID
ncbi:MAG: GNAT family N-acetyltransferase [Pseudomonadota bacterium]